ncbi:MAG TPA: type II CAAX endopeptidase family protein [Saprospiraceae bacterium]|nr:type II CAAX endopeptidase family protein [Saprospiraceae bacterium]
MTRYDHFIRLLVIISLIILGLFITAMGSAALLLLGGTSLDELMKMGQSGMSHLSPAATRILLLIQHLFTFIMPGLAFGLIFYKANVFKGLRLNLAPGWILAILGVFFLLAAYPLVNLSYIFNSTLPMPEWATNFENEAEETLKILLKMDNPWLFLSNLLIIAILPGIGEELIFRGVLQKELASIFKNPIVAIWAAAFIFSAIHLQFEGFFPRLVLGVVLGYLYYWTGNLWVCMIAHAFNNGIQIVLIYVTGMDVSKVDEQTSSQLQWWMIPISVGVMYMLYVRILKNRKPVAEN